MKRFTETVIQHGLFIVGMMLLSVPFLAAEQKQSSTIIFQEDFESGNLEQWDDDSIVDDPSRIKLVREEDLVYRGEYSLQITAKKSAPAGGKLNKWFMPGYDQVYARWYCKFAEDFDQGNHMHFCHLLANRWDNKWSGFGKAGRRPGGDDFFSTGLEPWRSWGEHPAPGALMLYAYHMDMPIDKKLGKYYGDMMSPEQPFVVKRDRWYCMEMMVKANSPGQADGEQSFWVDGKRIGHFTNIRWRTDKRLKINDFWLMLYVHDSRKVNRVWFDDIVISTDYIGPNQTP